MSSSPEAGLPPLVAPGVNGGLLEVFRRRYLLKLLVRRTIDSRYQGTALGWLCACCAIIGPHLHREGARPRAGR